MTEARRIRALGIAAGVAGPVLLAAYFTAPALTGWPYAGASPDELISYARSHEVLFYAGGWLQATGALLSVLFFLVLVQLSGRQGTLEVRATLVGAALLLAVVVVEAALLEAVPMAAANGDRATVATTFALSNGVFSRIFPLAPAPLLFAGAGFTLLRSAVLPRGFALSALAVAALFELAGIAAILSTAGLVAAIVMSVVEAIWILAAAIGLAAARAPASGPSSGPGASRRTPRSLP